MTMKSFTIACFFISLVNVVFIPNAPKITIPAGLSKSVPDFWILPEEE